MNTIFISSVATGGKDTLYKVLSHIFKDKIHLEQRAFANELKLNLDGFCRQHFGISAFTTIPKEKELIRPIFVEFGLIKRTISKGTYWWKLLEPQIRESIEQGSLPVITDLRYALYPEDEHFFAKNIMDGVIIHVTRYNKDGSKVLAPNSQERENDPKLEAIADYKLQWSTSDNFDFLVDTVKTQLSGLIERINIKYGIK